MPLNFIVKGFGLSALSFDLNKLIAYFKEAKEAESRKLKGNVTNAIKFYCQRL